MGQAAVAEDQALAVGLSAVVFVQSAYGDAARQRRRDDPGRVEAGREFEAGVQPGLQADQARGAIWQARDWRERLVQDGPALGVVAARAADVALQVALGDQRKDR